MSFVSVPNTLKTAARGRPLGPVPPFSTLDKQNDSTVESWNKSAADERMHVIMTSIFKAGYGEINEFVGRLSRAGMSAEMLERVNTDVSLAERMVLAIAEGVGQNATSTVHANPFSLSVDEILACLRQASITQGWDIGKDVFARLRETAPALHGGRLAFLSLRIRFGTGQKGVEQTANAHIAEILRVHGEKNVWRWDCLRTSKKHLRLLSGNDTHTPCVEWCVIDLDTHRKRQSIIAVRNPSSIADEGLVFAWLYPDYPRSIDYKENPGYFLAGYELNVPEDGGEPWYSVPVVSRYLDSSKVDFSADWQGDDYSDYAVSSLRE